MITHFYVNGFKSLKKFSLSFYKGLNVLIGPNGAGKSNICQALGLISAAGRGTITNYLLSLGGMTAAFSSGLNHSNTEQLKPKNIDISCTGEMNTKKGTDRLEFLYKYEAVYSFREEFKITNEIFLLKKKSQFKRFKTILRAERDHNAKLVIKIYDTKEMGPVAFEHHKKRKQVTLQLNERAQLSVLQLLSFFYMYCSLAIDDMAFSQAWNIDPHVARKPAEALESSMMLPDGRRLANAIYEMSKQSKRKLREINGFISHILPGFKEVVSANLEEGRRTFQVIDSFGRCPAQCLSDGTVKALALLVGIFGRDHSTSIIEEPENYLHPWACKLLVEFFRESFSDRVCILTTHSETILNSITPKEIIIVKNENGATKCSRLGLDQELNSAIIESGFGCGYHFVSGALGGVPE